MENQLLSTFYQLTDIKTPEKADLLVNRFAHGLGWNPSYFSFGNTDSFTNGHLIVEYGLENTAVLSFLKSPFEELDYNSKKKLLAVSYNNLVDWHIAIDRHNTNLLFNRVKSNQLVETKQILRDQLEEQLRSEAFEKILSRKPTSNIQSLDDALIQTISNWKRRISGELNGAVSNNNLSTLFNAIIFARALEDTERRFGGLQPGEKLLESIALSSYENNLTVKQIIIKSIDSSRNRHMPDDIIDFTLLENFDNLSKNTVLEMLSDFYGETPVSQYRYDFSIMSKHALSRIYEKYVSILYIEEDSQLSFLPAIPKEKTINKSFGAYYTPEFIAKFFARYIRKEFSSETLKKMKFVEPSVGSGIFLRTLLETIYEENLYKQATLDFDRKHFENIYGIDVDENAVQATKLSLALLHLVLFDTFPNSLKIECADSLDWFDNVANRKNFDVFVSNPPFVRNEEQTPEIKAKLKAFLGDLASGKSDLYFAFIKIAIDNLTPDGLALFVLPHNFLLSVSAKKLRAYLTQHAYIRFWADLTDISVFDAGVYVTLIIFQKKNPKKKLKPNATILKCRASVGKALQLALNNNLVITKNYEIYQIQQNSFNESEWTILSPHDYSIKAKMDQMPTSDKFLTFNQGFITGNDKVFIRPKAAIPTGESGLYRPVLLDTDIYAYSFPKESSQFVIYPYINGNKLTQEELIEQFPKTWLYLTSKSTELQKSKSSNAEWYFPHRPRMPKDIDQPKIVTPHLTISPRFALDTKGNFHVSRSPYITLKSEHDSNLFFYFLAVFNSTPVFWYISTHSHKYSKSYSMMEVKTLKKTPVPNPYEIDKHDFLTLIRLAKAKYEANGDLDIDTDRKIDQIVCRIYKLDEQETAQVLGL